MLKRLMTLQEGPAGLSAVEAAELLHFCFLDVLSYMDSHAQALLPSEAPAQPSHPPVAQGEQQHSAHPSKPVLNKQCTVSLLSISLGVVSGQPSA